MPWALHTQTLATTNAVEEILIGQRAPTDVRRDVVGPEGHEGAVCDLIVDAAAFSGSVFTRYLAGGWRQRALRVRESRIPLLLHILL
eukprot:8865498-Pyramimonas_sp.AAC.1